MAAKTKFRGSFTALVTPFKNGSVDEAAFRGLVNWQISEGTNGLVPVAFAFFGLTAIRAKWKRGKGT